jgi:hypothetical protein
MYDLPFIFLIIQSVMGSDIIYLPKVVLDYGKLLALCSACLTGFVGTLTSTHMNDLPLIILIIQSVMGSDTIHNVCTVVLTMGSFWLSWFI